MGTYHQLIVGNIPIYAMKSEVDPWLMSIFRETDKRVFVRKSSEAIGWIHSGEDCNETAYVYSNTIRNIKQRLDIMGISLSGVQEEFSLLVHEEIINLENQRPSRAPFPNLEILKNHSFNDWLKALSFILSNDTKTEFNSNDRNDLVEYLSLFSSVGFEHFPLDNFLSYLRIYLEAYPDESDLVYLDITYLVEAGYYYPDEKVCASALQSIALDNSFYQKTIILTEGSTDSRILNESLQLLYPHLHGYYSFMDFGVSNAAGGTSSLVNILKAFIGAGISNRVIAIFDNDTAAKISLKSIRELHIPKNIRIMHYPALEFAKEYPTIGPAGKSNTNINESACSIELYLGLDCLTIDGELSPVQWKGYDNSLHQYQGEIIGKQQIQEKFFTKLSQCNQDRSLIDSTDWSSINLIFQSIFNVFT